MKLCISLAVLLGSAALVPAQQVPVPSPFQSPAPPPDSEKLVILPDTVVLTVDGKPFKAKEMDQWLAQYPPEVRDAIKKEPEQQLTRLFAMQYLASEARKRKLDQMSPYKDAIESRVRSYLGSMMVQDESSRFVFTEKELRAYYDAHPDQFQSVKISAIYINYTPAPKPGPDGKMPRTEAEAKALAEDLVKQLRAGGDFAKLAAANSNDVESAKKGGEYATIRRSDNYPAKIKDAIFKLQDGEISDPVQQAPGFYIFKVTARITQSFPEVQTGLVDKVRAERLDQFMKGIQKDIQPKVEKREYFSPPKPPVATAANATPIPPPAIAPDTVVATLGGKPLTAKEMDEYMKLLPPQAKQAMEKETEASLTSLFLIVRLSDAAYKRKLDQESPHKQVVGMLALEGLTNAMVVEQNNSFEVTPTDAEVYYKSHLEQFEMANVSAIMVSFGANRKEEEAKAKAEDLVKQLRAGADFAALAKSSSDDKDSAAKGGEYGVVRRADKTPEPTKQIIFGLKDGAVSDPARQAGGFYIFKVTSKSVEPLAQVSAALTPGLKQQKYRQWITDLQNKYKVTLDKAEYFKK